MSRFTCRPHVGIFLIRCVIFLALPATAIVPAAAHGQATQPKSASPAKRNPPDNAAAFVDQYRQILQQLPPGPTDSMWALQHRFATLAERALLAEIRQQSPEQRLRILGQFVRSADGNDFPLEYIVQAAIGTDQTLRDKAIAGGLKSRLRQAPESSEYRAALRIAIELDAYDQIPGLPLMAIEFLIERQVTTFPRNHDETNLWLNAVRRAIDELSVADIPTACDRILAAHQRSTPDSTMANVFSSYAIELLAALDDKQFDARFESACAVAATVHITDWQSLADRLAEHGYTVPPRKHEVREANALVVTFMEQLRTIKDPIALKKHLGQMSHVGAQLPPEQGREVAAILVAAVEDSKDDSFLLQIRRDLQRVADHLTPDGNKIIVERLLAALGNMNLRLGSPSNYSEFNDYMRDIPEAHAVATARLLIQKRSDANVAGYLPEALNAVFPRIPAKERAEFLPALQAWLKEDTPALVGAVGAAAESLPDAERFVVGEELMQVMRDTVKNDAPPTADELIRLAKHGMAIGALRPSPQVGREAFFLMFDRYTRAANEKVKLENSRQEGNTSLALKVRDALGATFAALEATDRKAALAALQKNLDDWKAVWHSWAMLETLVHVANLLTVDEADAVFAQLLVSLEQRNGQFPFVPDPVASFIWKRPRGERARLVALLVPLFFDGRIQKSDRTDLIAMNAAGQVPSRKVTNVLQSTLALADKSTPTPCAVRLLQELAAKVPKADQPRAGKMLLATLQATKNHSYRSVLLTSINRIPHALTADQRVEVVTQEMTRLATLRDESTNVDIGPDSSRRSEIHALCDGLKVMARRLTKDPAQRVADSLAASLAELYDPQTGLPASANSSNDFEELFAVFAALPIAHSTENLTRAALAYVAFQHSSPPEFAGKIAPYFEGLQGEIQSGDALSLLENLPAPTGGDAATRSGPNTATTIAALANKLPQEDVAAMFDWAWSQQRLASSSAPQATRGRRNVDPAQSPWSRALAKLGSRLPTTAAQKRFEAVATAYAEATAPVQKEIALATALAIAAQAAAGDANQFTAMLKRLDPPANQEQRLQAQISAVAAAPDELREKFIADIFAAPDDDNSSDHTDASQPTISSIVPAIARLPLKVRVGLASRLLAGQAVAGEYLVYLSSPNIQAYYFVPDSYTTSELANPTNVGASRAMVLRYLEWSIGKHRPTTAWVWFNSRE